MAAFLVTLYVLATGADVAAILTGADEYRWITKLALMPILMALLISTTRLATAPHKILLLALMAAWLADAALLPDDELYFLAGIALFGAAQVLYMWIFIGRGATRELRNRWHLPAILLVLWAGFNLYFWNDFGPFAIPVLIYSLLLVSMAALSVGLGSKTITAGALIFVCSDLMIGIQLANLDFPGRAPAIMITYTLAQYLIVTGLIRHLTSDPAAPLRSLDTPLGARP